MVRGSIASCSSPGDEATAALLDRFTGTVLALGDTAYEAGTEAEFAACYDPTWGRHQGRTRPVPGNHEYKTPGAAGYFDYFGVEAGDPEEGYYSFDVGSWHLVALNSNCDQVGGCEEGSRQERWLRADLAVHPSACTLAFMHHPRFSSSTSRGGHSAVEPLWQALYEAEADVVLSGHKHVYERFAPQDPDGQPDTVRGLRQFVVGTGGGTLGGWEEIVPNSEVRDNTTYGVLRLALHEGWYEWAFEAVAGSGNPDAGRVACHDKAPEPVASADSAVRGPKGIAAAPGSAWPSTPRT